MSCRSVLVDCGARIGVTVGKDAFMELAADREVPRPQRKRFQNVWERSTHKPASPTSRDILGTRWVGIAGPSMKRTNWQAGHHRATNQISFH